MRQTTLLSLALVSLLQRVFADCYQPLLDRGPSRRYLYNPCMGARTSTPRCLSGAFARFFPESFGLTPAGTGSAHHKIPAWLIPQGEYFGAAVILLCSGSHAR